MMVLNKKRKDPKEKNEEAIRTPKYVKVLMIAMLCFLVLASAIPSVYIQARRYYRREYFYLQYAFYFNPLYDMVF